jgi:UrcA family protein
MSTNTTVCNTKSFVCLAAAAAYAALLGVAACTALLVSVQAKAYDVTVGVPVSTTGLDLSQQSGAIELYRRLRKAAHVACGDTDRVDLQPLRGHEFVVCFEKALGDAVRAANQPLLTTIYLKTHTPLEAGRFTSNNIP